MHPRNRYKLSRPDFKALGQKYPELKVHLVENDKGKPVLDFQNPEALKVLTICMLKEDYGLKIELPPDRLVPTLPLRLNYVHWIEDITKGWNKQELNAIDIGTGACCVYPILATSANPWCFLATEADEVNFSYAVKNMEQNKLTNKIKVLKVQPNTILEGIIAQTKDTYDFCMCNPPFFSDHFEAQGLVSRSPSRPEAKTMSTASPQEGIVPGGEVGFIRKMIEESNFLQDKVRVYTTMLGKKASLAPLKEILRRYKITNFATTEFCQGKTMRWGLAWTFDKSVTFPKSLFTQGKKEGKKSVVHVIPTQVGARREPLYDLVIFFKQIFSELKIHFREGKQTQFFMLLTLTAAENTWIHSRRKRRQMLREAAATSTAVTAETSSEPAATSAETPTSALQREGSPDIVSTGTVHPHHENMKDEDVSTVSSSTVEEGGDSVSRECGSSKGTGESSVKDLTGSVVMPPDTGNTQQQESGDTVSQSEQSQTHADSENHKRKSDTDTVESSDGPPAKRAKLEPTTSSSDASSNGRNLKMNSDTEMEESSDVTKHAVVDCPKSKSTEEMSEGTGVSHTSSDGDQIPSGKERDSSATEIVSPEDGREEKGKGEKSKDRPPTHFVLKCHMTVRVQGSDLAVELTWLDGQDIQLMHQLMQLFKNRLAQRKSPS